MGLQLVLDAVEAAVLAETGYSLTAEVRTDILQNVRVGETVQLPRRPLDLTVTPTVEGRRYMAAPASWTPLSGDFFDPTRGRMVLMGSLDIPVYEGSDSWPPQTGPSRFFRWRSMRWPLVKVVYKVQSIAENVPPELTSAIVQIAGAYASKIVGSGGNLQSVTALGVSESYFAPGASASALPPGVAGVLMPHRLNGGVRIIV